MSARLNRSTAHLVRRTPATGLYNLGITLFILLSLTFSVATQAKSNLSLEQQRDLFREAKQALDRGHMQSYKKKASQLEDYALAPYLAYWYMRKNLAQQKAEHIESFLQTYADSPLASYLRGAWLRKLAREKKWQDYLKFYTAQSSAQLRCHYHYAQLQTGDKEAAWQGAREMWLVGNSQDSACDPLFAAWERTGGLSKELRWERIELAMKKGNTRLARYLAKKLSKNDQNWLLVWSALHRNPASLPRYKSLQKDHERSRRLIVHALSRLASSNTEKAAELWKEYEKTHAFSYGERHKVIRSLALNFAFDAKAAAIDWFKQIPAHERDKTLNEWAVRAALRQQSWSQALLWLQGMPDELQQETDWQYWMARSLEAMGLEQEAATIYLAASHDRTYYGFLAADKAEVAYNLRHQPLEVDKRVLARLQLKPAVVRAKELLALNMTRDARREWAYTIATMSHAEKLAAGKLASEWNWHDRALITLAKADFFDDLEIRFPLAFSKTFFKEAETRELDPSWVHAVARQESALIPDIRSPVGAMGLMQLMPSTGRLVARQLKFPLRNRNQLLSPETNIKFGTFYLSQVFNQFDNNKVLATAAYNAGPHRVNKWYPQQASMDADIWVETMPFKETRQYVRRVLAYSIFYDQRLDREITRLEKRMPPVINKDQMSRCKACIKGNAV